MKSPIDMDDDELYPRLRGLENAQRTAIAEGLGSSLISGLETEIQECRNEIAQR